VPSGLSNVIAIAAGQDHSLALVSSRLPKLEVRVFANQLLLSWPASTHNFNLQTTTTLADPNSWTPVSDAPTLVNARYVATNKLSRASRFYRLK